MTPTLNFIYASEDKLYCIVFTSPGEEQHNQLIKQPEEQVQAEKGQDSIGRLRENKTQMIKPVITQQPKLLCCHIIVTVPHSQRERERNEAAQRLPKGIPWNKHLEASFT